jgi:hypothetical protein
MYVCTHTYVHACKCMCPCMHTFKQNTFASIHVHMHASAHAAILAHMHYEKLWELNEATWPGSCVKIPPHCVTAPLAQPITIQLSYMQLAEWILLYSKWPSAHVSTNLKLDEPLCHQLCHAHARWAATHILHLHIIALTILWGMLQSKALGCVLALP